MNEEFIKYIELLMSMTPKSGDIKKMHWQFSDSDPSRYDNFVGQSTELARTERLQVESTLTLDELENDKNFYQFKVTSWNSVLNSISHYVENKKLPENFVVVDICCGNAFLLHMIKSKFPKCFALGIDLFGFQSWDDIVKRHNGIVLTQIDVEDFVKITTPFQFDIGMSFNTLRGWHKNDIYDINFDGDKTSRCFSSDVDKIDPRKNLLDWLYENCHLQFSNGTEEYVEENKSEMIKQNIVKLKEGKKI